MARGMPATDGSCSPGGPFPPTLGDLIFPARLVTLVRRVLIPCLALAMAECKAVRAAAQMQFRRSQKVGRCLGLDRRSHGRPAIDRTLPTGLTRMNLVGATGFRPEMCESASPASLRLRPLASSGLHGTEWVHDRELA